MSNQIVLVQASVQAFPSIHRLIILFVVKANNIIAIQIQIKNTFKISLALSHHKTFIVLVNLEPAQI